MSQIKTPGIGSRWTRNGVVYVVECVTNKTATRPGWEVQVVYFEIFTSALWSRPLSEWYGKMKEVQS